VTRPQDPEPTNFLPDCPCPRAIRRLGTFDGNRGGGTGWVRTGTDAHCRLHNDHRFAGPTTTDPRAACTYCGQPRRSYVHPARLGGSLAPLDVLGPE
jgi:hypothetical protein